MRLLKRNLSTVYYCLYHSLEPLLDSNGNETGEMRVVYDPPVPLKCSISPATGVAQAAMFGISEGYDKVLITDDTGCPINESAVLFVDCKPWEANSAYDYTVKRIARSLNTVSYAISKVKVS